MPRWLLQMFQKCKKGRDCSLPFGLFSQYFKLWPRGHRVNYLEKR